MRLIATALVILLSCLTKMAYADMDNASAIINTSKNATPPNTVPAKAAPFLQNGASGTLSAATSAKTRARTKRVQTSGRSATRLCTGPITVTLYSGSLKANIERIAAQCGWYTVVWRIPDDYKWFGTARIAGEDLYNVFNKILYKYPLQAEFFHGNRVLAIGPRNLPPLR